NTRQAASPLAVEAVGPGQRELGARMQGAVQLAVVGPDSLEIGLDQLSAGHLACIEQGDAALNGQAKGLDPHDRGGTRKRPSCGDGAPPSTCSRGQLGRGASGRVTFSTSSAWAVGGTSARSSDCSASTWPRMPDSCSDMRATSSSLSERFASAATC